MTKFDWEKANRLEIPKEKRRVSNRTKVLKAYENGAKNERQRIIRMLIDKAIQSRLELCDDEADVYDFAVDLIKGEQK